MCYRRFGQKAVTKRAKAVTRGNSRPVYVTDVTDVTAFQNMYIYAHMRALHGVGRMNEQNTRTIHVYKPVYIYPVAGGNIGNIGNMRIILN